jgi:hypothetical protein
MAQNRTLAKIADWFFQNGTAKSVRDNYTRFLEDHDPSEQTHRELVQNSVAMFAEEESRAKQTTGGAINLEQGLVSMATDVEAKANTSGIKADRTSAVHAGQLPTVGATEAQVISDFNDVVLEIADDGTLTRNNFLAKLSETFRVWLGAMKDSVVNNINNITNLNTSVYGPGGTPATPTDPSLLTTVFGPSGDPNAIDGGLAANSIETIEEATDTNFTAKAVGDIMYWDGSDWVNLPAGVDGNVLESNGAGVAPSWETPSGGGGGATWKTVNLGDWNMNTTEFINVSHGLLATEYLTIRNISVMIRDDGNAYFPLETTATVAGDGIRSINNVNIIINRDTSGYFDGTNFDQTSYNRGFIRFQYTPD